VIRRHIGPLAECYKDPGRDGSAPTGSFTINFDITAEGDTASVTATQEDTPAASGTACVTKLAKTWKFPKPQGGGTVTVANTFAINP
jgi:hypothetical protein